MSQPFFIGEMLQSLRHLSDSLLDFLQYVHVCLALGGPELDTALQVWPHSAEQRGMITSLDLLVMVVPMQPRITISLCCKGSCSTW